MPGTLKMIQVSQIAFCSSNIREGESQLKLSHKEVNQQALGFPVKPFERDGVIHTQLEVSIALVVSLGDLLKNPLVRVRSVVASKQQRY